MMRSKSFFPNLRSAMLAGTVVAAFISSSAWIHAQDTTQAPAAAQQPLGSRLCTRVRQVPASKA